MANSLQEQLLKAGLVSEAQLNRSKKQEHRSKKKRGGGRGQPSASSTQAQKDAQRKGEQDRALNAKKEAERKANELRLQIRELVLSNAQSREGADVPYHVVRKGRIRKIYVTAAQRDQLAAGTLAVTTARGRHHVIPLQTAQRVAELMPEYFVYIAASDEPSSQPAADDPYAEYTVPDDLMW